MKKWILSAFIACSSLVSVDAFADRKSDPNRNRRQYEETLRGWERIRAANQHVYDNELTCEKIRSYYGNLNYSECQAIRQLFCSMYCGNVDRFSDATTFLNHIFGR